MMTTQFEFRPMRRKRQQLSEEECIDILNNATSGTLALLGDGGYPYSLPISFVYAAGKIFFPIPIGQHSIGYMPF